MVEEHLRSLDVGREGYVFLVNDRGELVYHKDTGFFTSPEKKEQLLTLLAEGDRYDKKKNLLVYRTEIENTGWILVGVVSLDTLKMLEQQLLEVVLFVVTDVYKRQILMLDPDRVVIGGGISKQSDILIPLLEKDVYKRQRQGYLSFTGYIPYDLTKYLEV